MLVHPTSAFSPTHVAHDRKSSLVEREMHLFFFHFESMSFLGEEEVVLMRVSQSLFGHTSRIDH